MKFIHFPLFALFASKDAILVRAVDMNHPAFRSLGAEEIGGGGGAGAKIMKKEEKETIEEPKTNGAAAESSLASLSSFPAIPPASFQNVTINSVTSGSTTTSTDLIPAGASACGTSLDNGTKLRWYHIVGTGRKIVASTCSTGTNFDTKISVWSGDGTCVGGNDNYFFCAAGNTRSIFSWTSAAGTDYYIMVHGSNTAGSFDLDVSDAFPVIPPASFQDVTINSVTSGSTTTSTDLIPAGASYCGAYLTEGTKLRWYHIVGTGREIVASTCSTGTNFDTRISVWSGDGTCVGGNDDTTCAGEVSRSWFSWTSAAGMDYYIMVHGFGESGAFDLDVSDPFPAIPPASFQNVTINSVTSGSTTTSTDLIPVFAGYCGRDLDEGVKLRWYRIVGTGLEITASTCSTGTDFDTKISVWSGDGTCVGGNDDGVGCEEGRSRFSWTSAAGMDYYIMVHAYLRPNGDPGLANGTFDLHVSGQTEMPSSQPSLMPSESLMPSAQPSLMQSLMPSESLMPSAQTSKSGKISKASIAKSGKTNKVTANQMDESFMVTLSANEEEEWLSFSFGPGDDLSLDYNFAMGEDDEAKDTMSL